MYRLARNASTDLYHARPKELPEAEDAPEAQATGPHPLEALERTQTVKDLNRAMGRLPADAREALLLARFSGLKYVDIGGILGISEGAVKGRVHRAVLDLKKAYRAEQSRPGRNTGR
jgi:RNA polymerase sigma-70 factor (ECF subfamily)